jgi:hypothetical protein
MNHEQTVVCHFSTTDGTSNLSHTATVTTLLCFHPCPQVTNRAEVKSGALRAATERGDIHGMNPNQICMHVAVVIMFTIFFFKYFQVS